MEGSSLENAVEIKDGIDGNEEENGEIEEEFDARNWPIIRLILNLDENAKVKAPPLLVWRRMARVVRMLCAVCIALRNYAMEAGLLENYTVSVSTRRRLEENGREQVEELSFNLDDYKLARESKVPKTIRDLLEKPSHTRTPDDLYAVSSMMREMPSFRKYTKEMQTMMCKIVRYMKCGKRRVVLRKGHIGYSVYFIFSGSVNVVLNQDDQSVFTRERILTLKKGACFGEIALMQNTRRNATIVCADETEFLVVDKDEFLANGLDKKMQEEFTDRFTFFRNWEPLSHWSDEQIKSLSYISRTEDFSHNRIIAKDSSKSDNICFVIEGSCDVMRHVDLKDSEVYQYICQSNTSCSNLTIDSTSVPRRTTSHPRAQSAPHKAKTLRTSSSHRPETSLGMNKELQHMTGAASEADLSSDSQKAGIYVKVDTLRDGSCFGLSALYDSDDVTALPKSSLISRGCTLIHMPRSRFKELADNKTLVNIKPLIKLYPSDEDLCQDFLCKAKWEQFKQNILGVVMKEHEGLKHVQEGTRDCLRLNKRPITESTFLINRIDGGSSQSRPVKLANIDMKTRSGFGKITVNDTTKLAPSPTPRKVTLWEATDALQSSTARGDRYRMRSASICNRDNPTPRLLVRATVTRTVFQRKVPPTKQLRVPTKS